MKLPRGSYLLGVPPDRLILDPRVQARVEINQLKVNEYAQVIGRKHFPPPIGFGAFDKPIYIGGGFHRTLAARKAKLKELVVEVRPGGLREAQLFALGDNAEHGLTRTNADKRYAITLALRDKELGSKSSGDIAGICNVSRPLVEEVRAELEAKGELKGGARVGADGKRYRIGLDRLTPEVLELLADHQVADDRGQLQVLARLKPEQQLRAAQLLKGGLARNAREAADQVKRAGVHELAEQVAAEPQPLPTGKFRVILADPPWPFEARDGDPTHRGRLGYPTMTIEQICALDVGSRAHKDCVLWLWWPWAFVEQHVDVLRAWGFRSRAGATWDKVIAGPGNYLWNVTEQVTIAVRGNPIIDRSVLSDSSLRTLFKERKREPSRKPERVYEMIEKLCPGSKLELFARQKRPGWTSWGAEVDHFPQVEELPPAGRVISIRRAQRGGGK